MNLKLRTQFILLVCLVAAVTLGGLAPVFLRQYWNDRINSLHQSEINNLNRSHNQFDNLLRLSELIEVGKIKSSHDILMLADDPCHRDKELRLAVSDTFQKQLDFLNIDKFSWVNDLDVFKACSRPFLPISIDQAKEYILLPSRIQLMNPFILVMIRDATSARLALLSMAGFETSEFATSFIANQEGKVIWSADGTEYLSTALGDVGLTQATFAKLLSEAVRSSSVLLQDVGKDGLLSTSPIGPNWIFASLSYKPFLVRPVQFALEQLILFSMALLILVALVGKLIASRITEPLKELQKSAARVGDGDFSVGFEVRGDNEISAVKAAFNVMGGKIRALLEDTKKKTELESELKVARSVQEMLFPPASLRLGPHEISSCVRSASQCGGDFWGCFEVGSLSIVLVGDATGHGVPSALLTAAVRGGLAVISAWITQSPELAKDPRIVLEFFNRTVSESAHGAIQMTFCVCVLDPISETFTTAGASHPSPYLIEPPTPGVAPGRPTSVFPLASIPLGHLTDFKYTELTTHPWLKGSKLILYTDGLTDGSADGSEKLFERKKLIRLLAENSKISSSALLKRIMAERDRICQGHAQPDDITVVVCERN